MIIRRQSNNVEQGRLLDTLGTAWFLDYSIEVTVPAGKNRIFVVQDVVNADLLKISNAAAASPGSVWHIYGEPNKFTSRSGVAASVAAVVPSMRAIYETIQSADPAARITSPGVLNWDWTCNGCGSPGFATGQSWMEEFISQYELAYGEAPPFDIWSMNTFPLDWGSFPTVRSDLVINQLRALSDYLLSKPEYASKPIWITELGLHWGWDSFTIPPECNGWWKPAGTYQTAAVKQYLTEVFSWIDANASARHIEKVFLLSTYSDITECNASSYAGLTLFNGTTSASGLTEVGRFYRDWIAGIKN